MKPLRANLFDKYQSLSSVGKLGTRNTEKRLEQYGLSNILRNDFSVLDIGCNEGVISLMLAQFVEQVIGVEVNAEYVRGAEQLKLAMGLNNIQFICNEFNRTLFNEKKFDLILSLATHHWMDDLRSYAFDLYELLNFGGYLLLESHNLNRAIHKQEWSELNRALPKLTRLRIESSEEDLVYLGDRERHRREIILLRKERFE